ncbi:hypothetical protein QG37_04074 [Candidozyma auris]|uniref:Uncharacterized protein n=1 Tax=Candidozyma auris TaxID=498019 RepID=A0A0L0NYH7_CANAR|nr:hypothetical protein QG37_04074 [[Candida] auris]
MAMAPPVQKKKKKKKKIAINLPAIPGNSNQRIQGK